MGLKWYIVHTYSGFENKVKTNLEERVKTLGQEAYFGNILVPVEQVIELSGGKRRRLQENSILDTSWSKWM